MPQRNEPITRKPKVEDESTGNGSEKHGVHREGDEALPGRGDTKGGLGKASGSERPSPAHGRDEGLETGRNSGQS